MGLGLFFWGAGFWCAGWFAVETYQSKSMMPHPRTLSMLVKPPAWQGAMGQRCGRGAGCCFASKRTFVTGHDDGGLVHGIDGRMVWQLSIEAAKIRKHD